jgi:hypothetical protein
MRLLYSWLFEDFDWEQFSKPSSAESDPVLDTITKNADNPEFKKAIEDHQKTKTDLLHQTLENNKKLLLKKHINVSKLQRLGQGTRGIAFGIDEHKVLKITDDNQEAASSNTLKGKSLKRVAQIYDVWQFPNTKLYGIILERVIPFEQITNTQLTEPLEGIVDIAGLKNLLNKTQGNWDSVYNSLFGSQSLFLSKSKEEIVLLQQAFSYLREADQELKQSGLQFFDYNLGNIGMRQGTNQVVIFDIGYSIGGTPPGLLENKRFSKFLFENLNVNNLALLQKDSTYILYDSRVLNTIQLPPRRSNTPVNLNVDHCFVAGIIARSAKEQGLGNCNGALTVRLAVRTKNSEYKSAGILLYKIVSSINKLPLISDRERSTSEQAKQVWKRFESDSQAKQVPMDNFLNQQYVDIGSTGNYVPRTGSKTPSQADDCQVNDIAKSLGHPEGFIFNVDTNMFTTNHSNTVQTVLPRLGLTEDSLFEKLETAMHNSFSG